MGSGDYIVQGINPQRILALSFTKRAAIELKERLEKKAIRRVKASTFHSLCNQILLQYYQEAGFSRKPTIWTSDAELKALMAEAMRLGIGPALSRPHS